MELALHVTLWRRLSPDRQAPEAHERRPNAGGENGRRAAATDFFGGPIIGAMLSIIVPTLDEAEGIAAALAALAPLRARGAEVIVADGGSADGTAVLALPY